MPFGRIADARDRLDPLRPLGAKIDRGRRCHSAASPRWFSGVMMVVGAI